MANERAAPLGGGSSFARPCGNSNKTCLLFAKKVLCGRTKIFWVLACCSCCTKQTIFAAEANNHLRQRQEQFWAETLNDLR